MRNDNGYYRLFEKYNPSHNWVNISVKKFQLYGIGAALVDTPVVVPDAFLEQYGSTRV